MIVAEIGLNHLGDSNLLNSYFEYIRDSEVDAVTVQVLKESFFDDLRYRKYRLEDEKLIDFLKKVKCAGKKIGIAIDDIDKIGKFEALKVDFYKVLSKDMLNVDLITELFYSTVKYIYVSTGMNTYQEIDDLISKFNSDDGRLRLIHTQLSHEISDVNMRAIGVMQEKYDLPIAYGHHCKIIDVIYTSLGFDPESIFFYVKGFMDLEYPDDLHAIKVDRVGKIASKIKLFQQSIGSGMKIKVKNWTS